MGEERKYANQKHKTKLIALEILLYYKRRKKWKKKQKTIIDRIIKDRIIRDIWTLFETEEVIK